LRQLVFAVSTVLILSACTAMKPIDMVVDKSNKKTKIETQSVEESLSYQDIITKINKINISKSGNQRTTEIIKEYKYNTSDDDSKNSARKKALNQVKILILEEIGVFVESYLELSTLVENEKYQKSFKQEIKNLTAGIIKTKIIDEKYNGSTYYVKASVLVDPDSVSEGISEILKIRANKEEISKLSSLLRKKESEIDLRSNQTINLQKKITAQELLNNAKASELVLIQKQLDTARVELKKYQITENRMKNELQQILNRINSQTNDVTKQIFRGMTKNEVKGLLGTAVNHPDSYENSWTYGRVVVWFRNNTVGCLLKDTVKFRSCDGYTQKYESWAIIK